MLQDVEVNKTTIKCECGTEFTVHDPYAVTVTNEAVYSMTLVPSWSISERVCPGCKKVYVPVVVDPKIVWGAPQNQPTPQEKSRIVSPEGIKIPRLVGMGGR